MFQLSDFQSDGASVYLGCNPGKTEGKICCNTLKKVSEKYSSLNKQQQELHFAREGKEVPPIVI